WRWRSLALRTVSLAAMLSASGAAVSAQGQEPLEQSLRRSAPIENITQSETVQGSKEADANSTDSDAVFPDIPRSSPGEPQESPSPDSEPGASSEGDAAGGAERSPNGSGTSLETKEPKPESPPASGEVAGEEPEVDRSLNRPGDRDPGAGTLSDTPNPDNRRPIPERLRPLLPRRDAPATRPDFDPLNPDGFAQEDPAPNVPPELLEPVDPWRAYRLSPLDRVVVQVFGYPDLSFNTNVDQGGRILVPLVGFLKVEGLTLEELQEALTSAYDQYVVDPEVLVTLGSQVNPDVVVSGEVVRPGFYRVGSFETVVQALISAGGVKDSADLRAIALRRRLPDGTLLEQELNLLELLAEGLPEPRLFLQDGDVVFVPRREVVNDPTYNFALATLNNLGQPTIRVRLLAYVGEGGLRSVTLPTGSSFLDVLNGLPLSQVNLRKISLIRFEAEQGTVVTQELDGRAAILGDLTQNPQLRDNDVIVVNRNLVTKLTVFFNRFTQPFRDVLGFLLFFRELDQAADELFGPDGAFTGGSDNNNDNNNNNN
ncbi:MAG: polysaccharide biosynthesis/export family protein, partial [Cyanobacteria bacterium P01_D01_bin.73]